MNPITEAEKLSLMMQALNTQGLLILVGLTAAASKAQSAETLQMIRSYQQAANTQVEAVSRFVGVAVPSAPPVV